MTMALGTVGGDVEFHHGGAHDLQGLVEGLAFEDDRTAVVLPLVVRRVVTQSVLAPLALVETHGER